jgi:hypothetical protein
VIRPHAVAGEWSGLAAGVFGAGKRSLAGVAAAASGCPRRRLPGRSLVGTTGRVRCRPRSRHLCLRRPGYPRRREQTAVGPARPRRGVWTASVCCPGRVAEGAAPLAANAGASPVANAGQPGASSVTTARRVGASSVTKARHAAAAPVVREAQRARADHACAQRFHPFPQTPVCGDDDVVSRALALEQFDDGVVAFAFGGDDPRPGNGFHAAGGAFDDEDQLGLVAGARHGRRPGGGKRVAQPLGGAGRVAPPAIRHRSDHVRGVHDDQHTPVVPGHARNTARGGRRS